MTTKGQSLVELIMVLPLFIVFWASILWFAKALIISIELLHTARHGVFCLVTRSTQASAPVERRQTLQECTAFLQRQNPSIELERVTIQVHPGDVWTPLGPKNLLDIPKLIKLAGSFTRLLKNSAGLIRFKPAEVDVRYKLPVPPLLQAIPGFPVELTLRGYCVCYR